MKGRTKKLNLQKHKALFILVVSLITLLASSPTLQRVLVYPQTDFFTELYLLGPEHKATDYPHNIIANDNYAVNLGITNHLGECAYYVVEVKFRNQTQYDQDNSIRPYSNMPSLYNLTFFVADKESLEVPITFVFDYSFSNITRVFGSSTNAQVDVRTNLRVNFHSLRLNGAAIDLKGYSSTWDSQTEEFFGDLVFELWTIDSSTGVAQFNNRSVDIELNFPA